MAQRGPAGRDPAAQGAIWRPSRATRRSTGCAVSVPRNRCPWTICLHADEAEGPEAQALRREQAETLRRLLLEMAADDREIFVRFYYYRQTVREIAQIMERNESTVKARLARGRARLRDKLTKEADGYAD